MNSLFSCSWVQKTAVLRESYVNKQLLTEEFAADIVSDVKKKMGKLNIGVPYRDSRLFFYEFLLDKHPDKIPTEFKTESTLTPEEAYSQIVSMEMPDKRLVRHVDDDDNLYYAVKFGSTRYELKLKGGNEPRNIKISELNPDDIEEAKSIYTRKLVGVEVNSLFDKIVIAEKDPTAFVEQIKKEFTDYAEEKDEGTGASKVVAWLNLQAAMRAGKGVKGQPKDPETGERILAPKEEIIDVFTPKEPIVFTPGVDAYDTLKKNLKSDDEITYLMRGMGGYNIFKAEVGNYEYRMNLKGLGANDLTIDQIAPENVGEIFVYDITKEPAEGERPPQVFSTEPDYSKIPETPEDTIDYEEPTTSEDEDLTDDDDRGYGVSGPSSDWDSEDEETPCVHGCKCSKCMQKANSQPVAKKPEIVIKLSTEQVNRQMIEAYRRKQQNNHRIDRRYGLGY